MCVCPDFDEQGDEDEEPIIEDVYFPGIPDREVDCSNDDAADDAP